jgi:twitching motility protein PilJ
MAKRTKAKAARTGSGGSGGIGILLSLLAAAFAALALVSYLAVRNAEDRNTRLSLAAAAQKTLVQQSARSAADAVQGSEAAFGQLRADLDRFQHGLDTIKNGSPQEGIAPSPAAVEPQLRVLEGAWLGYREGLDRILDSEKNILAVRELAKTAESVLPEVVTSMTKAADLVAAENAPAPEVLDAARQVARLEVMKARLGSVLAGG